MSTHEDQPRRRLAQPLVKIHGVIHGVIPQTHEMRAGCQHYGGLKRVTNYGGFLIFHLTPHPYSKE